jgi:hypothetical protein
MPSAGKNAPATSKIAEPRTVAISVSRRRRAVFGRP